MEVTLGTGALEKTDRNTISYDTKVKTECGAPLHSVSFQVELSDSLLLSNDQLNILPQNIFSDSETIKSAVGEDFDRVKLESEGNEVKDCKRKTVTNKNNDRKDKVQEEKSDEETTVNDDGKNVGKNTAVETNGTSDRNKTLKELNSSKKSTPKSKKGFQIDLIVNRLKTSQANEISPTPCKTTANISKGLAKTQYDTDEKSTTCETTLKYVKTECGSMQCLGCNAVYTLMTELENHFQICGTGSCSEGKVTEESQKDLDNEHNEAAIKPEPGDVENTNGCVTVAASDNCIQTNLSSQGNGRHSTKCPFCHEKFDGYIEYLDHKYMCQNSGIHTDGSDIKLEPNVSEEYSSDAYLSSHVTSDVGTNECVSNELGITGMFYNTGARVVEINNASSDNLQFHCQACGLQFGTIYELSGHSYNCTQRQEVSSGSEAPARGVTAVDYSCRKCEASFNSGKELIGHRLKCTGKKKTGVAVNISKKGKKTSSKRKAKEPIDDETKVTLTTPPDSIVEKVEGKPRSRRRLKCNLCKRTFKNDGLLSQHLVSEHIETVQGDVDTDKSETDGDQKGNEKKRKQDDEDSDYNDSAVESPKVVKRRRRSIKNVQAFPNSKCGTNSSMESEMKVETGVVPVKLEKNGEGSDTNAVFDRKMALRLKVQRNFEERQKMASLNKLDPEYRSFLPKLGAIGFYHCFFEHCGQPFLNEEMFLMHIKEEIIRQNTVYPYYVSTKAMSPQELKDNLKSMGLSMLVFSCNHEKCQHIYFTLEEMKKHIIEAHTKFRFPCEKEGCMRGFETKNELKSHIIVDHSVAKCVKSSFTPSLQETVETVYQQQLLNISKTQESMMTIPEKGNQTAPVKFEEVLKSYSIDKITSLIMENEKKMAMLKQLEDQSKVGTLAKKENLQKRGQLAVKQKEQKQRRKKKVKKKGNIMNRKGDSDNGSEAEDMNHDESENDLEDNQGKESKGLGNISEISVNSRDTIAVNTKQATSIFNGEAKDGAADNVPVLGSYSKENLDHIEKEVNLEVPDVLNEDRLFEKFLLKNDSEDLLDENEDLIGSSSNESSTIDVVGIDSKACIEDKKGHFKLKISLKSKKSLKNTGSLKAILGKAFRKKKSKLKQKCLATRLNKVVDGESENADNFHGVEKETGSKEKIHEKKAFIRKKKERKSCKSTNSDERSDVNNRLSKDENGDNETGATLVTSSAVELDRESSEEVHDKKAFIRLAKTKRRKKNDKIADKVICNSSLCQNINKSNYPEVPDPENENMSNTSRKEKVEDVSKETEKEPSYTDTITAYSCKSKSCKEVFTSQNALRDHVRAAHMNIQVCVYKCPVSDCFEVFTSKTELDNHKMSDHNVDLNDGKAADKAGNGDNFADSGYMCPVCKKAFSEEKEAVQHSKNCQKRAFLKSVYRATGAENVLPYKNHWTTRKNSLSTDKKLISSEETQSIIGALYGKVETDKVSKLAEKVDNTENLDSFVKENLNENNLDKQKIDMTPFSCRNCFLECSSELELSIHIQNAHDPEGLNKIPCKLCPRFFPSEAFLQEHYTLYHGNHPYKCGRRACRAVFLSRVEFDLHLAMHDEMKFICDVPGCNRAFKFRPSLMKHKSEDHACICSLCPFQTESFKELQAHLKTAHKKWPHHCQTDSCKMSFETKDELRQHIEKSHWELDISRLPYKCTGLGCTQGFLHKKDYNQHKEVCDKVMTFPCQFCNMIFASQVSLECHRSADHVLKCGNCSLTFITVNQLRNHMVKSHSQFECETCKEKFTSRDKLQFHVYSFHAKRTVSNDSKSKSFNDISMVTFSTSATEITSPEIEMKSEPLDEYERENSHSYTDVAIKSEPLDEHQYEIETMFDCVPQEMQSAVDVKIEEVGNG